MSEAKSTKTVAQYRDRPNGKEKCRLCTMYVSRAREGKPSRCTSVQGDIEPYGWCKYFKAKA